MQYTFGDMPLDFLKEVNVLNVLRSPDGGAVSELKMD